LANKIQSELEQEMKANLVYKQQQQITRMERKYDRKKKQNEERKRQRQKEYERLLREIEDKYYSAYHLILQEE